MVADQRVACLVVAVSSRAERARRNEAVGAGLVELTKKPARVTPLMRPSSSRDASASKFAISRRRCRLGLHGAPLGAECAPHLVSAASMLSAAVGPKFARGSTPMHDGSA
jgi:hypothetical protein